MKKTLFELGITQEELDSGLTLSGALEVLSETYTLDNCRAALSMIDCFSYELDSASTINTLHLQLTSGSVDINSFDANNLLIVGIGDYFNEANIEYRTVSSVNLATNPIQITVSSPFSSSQVITGRPAVLVWEQDGESPFISPFINIADSWQKYIIDNILIPPTVDVVELGYKFDDSAWTTGNDFRIRARNFQIVKGSEVPVYVSPPAYTPVLDLSTTGVNFKYAPSDGVNNIDFTFSRVYAYGATTWEVYDTSNNLVTGSYLTSTTNTSATLTRANFEAIGLPTIKVRASVHSGIYYKEIVIDKLVGSEPFLPPGLKFGGAGEFTFANNTNFSGGVEYGTVQIITAGEYLHPDGVVRTVPTTNEVLTTYTDTTYPPSGVFYIVYSDDTTVSTFFGQDFGTVIYNSETNIYTLVKPGNTQNFNPTEETVIIAIGKRLTTDTGIGSLINLVSWRYNVRPGEIDAGAIDSNTAFANTIRPIEIVDALPSLPNGLYPEGCLVYLTTDGKIYRNSSVTPFGWTKAVDGGDIEANSIVAGKIAAGAIGADEIAANAITAKHLVIADLTNLVPDDGDFETQSTASWDGNPTDFSIASTEPKFGTYHAVMTADGTANGNYKAEYIPVEPGQQYYCSVWYKTTAGFTASGEIYPFIVEWSDENKTNKTWTIPVSTTSTPVATYTQGTGTVTVPAGKYYMRPGMSTRPTALTGDMYVDGMIMRRVNGGELIVDGAITSSKLDTNLVYAGAIQLDVPGHIYSGKTTSDSTAAGFWLGTETGPDPAFHVGDATSYLKYTTADGINIRGPLYTSGKTSISDPTAGVFMGDDGSGGYDFAVGTTSEGIAWDASAGTFSIYGDIVGTGNLQLNSVTQTKFGVGTTERLFSEIFETFSASSIEVDPTTEWYLYFANGETSIITDTEATSGGKALQTGDNGGSSDRVWAIHRKRIPFDPNLTYRIKFRVRRSAGLGAVYCGWTGFAADGTTKVNVVSGTDTYSGQHYHCTTAAAPGSTYTEFTGYTKGWGATAGSGSAGTITSPGYMHPNVRYISPVFITNWTSESGIIIVDSILVDIVADDTLVSNVSADKITAGTISSNITHTGEIILSQNGNLYTSGKSTYASTTPGVFLGYDAGETDYVLNIGGSTSYIKWDGGTLTVSGNVILGDYTQGTTWTLCSAPTARSTGLTNEDTYVTLKEFTLKRTGTVRGDATVWLNSIAGGVVQSGAWQWVVNGTPQQSGTISTTTHTATGGKILTLTSAISTIEFRCKAGLHDTNEAKLSSMNCENVTLKVASLTGEVVVTN